MEARTAVHDRLGVFRDLAVQNDVGLVIAAADRVGRAHADAAATADALVVVNVRLFVGDGDGAVRADARAHTAADAGVLIDLRLAGVVLLHLARARATAHADILERAAEAARLMALEVGQRNEHIRVHDGLSDLGFLDVFAALDRHISFVRAFQAVRNDDMAAGRERRKAVEIGGIQMIERILAPADIQCVAVGQERLAAALLNEVRDRFCPVRTQKRKVARLTEVNFDGGELFVKVDAVHACRLHQAGQLLL